MGDRAPHHSPQAELLGHGRHARLLADRAEDLLGRVHRGGLRAAARPHPHRPQGARGPLGRRTARRPQLPGDRAAGRLLRGPGLPAETLAHGHHHALLGVQREGHRDPAEPGRCRRQGRVREHRLRRRGRRRRERNLGGQRAEAGALGARGGHRRGGAMLRHGHPATAAGLLRPQGRLCHHGRTPRQERPAQHPDPRAAHGHARRPQEGLRAVHRAEAPAEDRCDPRGPRPVLDGLTVELRGDSVGCGGAGSGRILGHTRWLGARVYSGCELVLALLPPQPQRAIGVRLLALRPPARSPPRDRRAEDDELLLRREVADGCVARSPGHRRFYDEDVQVQSEGCVLEAGPERLHHLDEVHGQRAVVRRRRGWFQLLHLAR
mmetsp:Transcript_2735/g.10728  ORF Transcript_2735/g.10728 Transcript_2735/m.10728 type:complete len:378 (+) Transcript_2735:3525-4658(+)